MKDYIDKKTNRFHKRSNAFKDKTGNRYGRLLVIELDLEKTINSKSSRAYWKCKCDCGNFCIRLSTNLSQDTSRSCGCLAVENGRKAAKKRRGEFGASTKHTVFLSYKSSAKRRKNNVSFELTFEEFLDITKQNCHYCNDSPSHIQKSASNNGDFIYNGIDRVDNDKGYILDNCVPCCTTCNYMKSKMGYSKFINQTFKIVKYRNKNEEK